MNETQRQALEVLAKIWALSPEVRLGQLMAHLGFLGEVHVEKRLGTIEDDEFLAILYRHRAELKARLSGDPTPTLRPVSARTSVSGDSALSSSTVGPAD